MQSFQIKEHGILNFKIIMIIELETQKVKNTFKFLLSQLNLQ